MRFNGKDLRDVHRALSIEREIPPGTARRKNNTIRTGSGEIYTGYDMEAGTYRVRINIFARDKYEAGDVRALLAAWAGAGGQGTAKLEPTNRPGKYYEAALESISDPEFVRGKCVVEVVFTLPRPTERDMTHSTAAGEAGCTARIRGSAEARPIIRQTIKNNRNTLVWSMDGKRILSIWGEIAAGSIVEMDTGMESLTIDGVHRESMINFSGTEWRPGYTPGEHVFTSSDGGAMEARWQNEWI